VGKGRRERAKRKARMRHATDTANYSTAAAAAAVTGRPGMRVGPRRPQDRQLLLMSSIVTIADVNASVPPESSIAEALALVPVERTLDWVARMLGSLFHRGDKERLQVQLAHEWFAHDPEALNSLLEHLRAGSGLLVTPVLKLLAMLALLHGSDSPAGDHEDPATVKHYLTRTLPVAMLTAANYYGDASYGPSGSPPTVSATAGSDQIPTYELELAANVLANHSPYPPSMFDRSERRWIEIPAEDHDQKAVNLAEQFQASTGARLDDLRMIGLALHARAINPTGAPRVKQDYLAKLNLGPDRLGKALEVISAPLEELRDQTRSKPPTNLYDTPLLAQYPLIRLNDGQLLVMSPDLVAERTYGWLPKWDLQNGALVRTKADRAAAGRAITYLQHSTEIHAMETLVAAVAASSTRSVVYGESDIQDAWGTSGRNADAIVWWPDTAVVAEISSRPPSLDTLLAQAGSGLVHDLDLGVIAKAEQLHGTIEAFRANPTALAGVDPAPSRFQPVLVTTEGFPVTPLTVCRIRDMLADANLLQATDVAPLVITDVETLEAVETIGEGGGPNLSQLLTAHETSPMVNYGFREWLLLTYPGTREPTRVAKRWARVQEPVLEALLDLTPGRPPLVRTCSRESSNCDIGRSMSAACHWIEPSHAAIVGTGTPP
jgi:hypothetical protein